MSDNSNPSLAIDRRKVLESYLGEFFVQPISSPEILNRISSDILSPDYSPIVYQVDCPLQFRQVVQAAILAYNRNISYKVCEAFKDIVEVYNQGFAKSDDGSQANKNDIVAQLSKPELLVIYYPRKMLPNKYNYVTPLVIAESRAILSKKTLFVTFQSEPFPDLKPVVLKSLLSSQSSSKPQSKVSPDSIL